MKRALSMIVRTTAVALAMSVCSIAAIAGVRDRLVLPPVLRGQFEQTRHLQGFHNPLVSRGDFVMARDRGVLWETRKPFASTTVIGKERLLTRRADGSSEVVLDKSQAQAVGMLDTLMPAMLGGDLDALSKFFVPTEGAGEGGQWKVDLLPRTPGLAKVFVRIVLQGDRYVRSVHLEEKGGDSTDIVFTSMTDQPRQLDPAEAKQFE